MELKKNVFSLRNQNESNKGPLEAQSTAHNMPMSEWGWNKSKTHNGTTVGLKVCLQQIYQDHKEKMRKDQVGQEEKMKPYRIKLKEREGDIQIYNDRITKIKENELPEIERKISEHKNKIIEIKKNPEDITGERSSRMGLFVGATILAFITIYLFVFYSSASYSAFFKEFGGSDFNVANSIFDAQAIAKAFSDGILTGVLILTLPFLFLGLGYIVDEFKNRKDKFKVLKIGLIISVTFIFDVILAYRIEKSIYDAARQGSFEPETIPNFDWSYALTSNEFWLIIFAGFVAYLIWGLVFSFVMEAHENSDKVHTAVKAEKEKIKNLQSDVESKETEINKLEYKIGENKREIEKLSEIINHSEFIDYKELENRIMQFFDGWLEWMNANKKDKGNLQEAHEVVEIFISNNIKITR